jgi:nucleotide-binding universal stress UspA family protein
MLLDNRWLLTSDGSAVANHAAEVARNATSQATVAFRTVRVHSGVPVHAGTDADDANIATISLQGIPGVEIAHAADEHGAGVVVLGRRSRPGWVPLPLGGTTEAVLRRHSGLCLMIPVEVCRLRRVVLAIDGTPRGSRLLGPAAALVRALGADACALHVCTDALAPITTEDCWSHPATRRAREDLESFPEFGAGSMRVVTGPPATRILEFLQQHQTDLLVLGIRRGGPAGDAGSGHIGRDLLSTAPTAILTVPI